MSCQEMNIVGGIGRYIGGGTENPPDGRLPSAAAAKAFSAPGES
ncbi:MAG: hypothetical protein RAO92_00345 [Candidatus Euphemobacter frigidus]|nr:hypothetical protein [Candidatus Euphemobacter frigidus]MDP8274827.1 hypothetical protein [Candidatus Euphemobacter frigidus]